MVREGGGVQSHQSLYPRVPYFKGKTYNTNNLDFEAIQIGKN